MTLQPQGKQSLETICKDCVFAVYDGDNQSGCKAKRLESFAADKVTEATDNEKEFYVIKGVCPSYRPPSWGEANLEKIREELRPSFTLILDVDEYTRPQLLELQTSLRSIFYYESVDVILAHRGTYDNKDIVSQMVHEWMGKKKFRVIQYHDDLTKPEIDAELLRYVKGKFFSMSPVTPWTEDLMRAIEYDFSVNYGVFIVASKSDSVMVMSSALKFYQMSDGKTYQDFEDSLLDGAKTANLYKKF